MWFDRIQLLDQGLLQNLERNYRKKLLEKLIQRLGEQGVIEWLKHVTWKDVLNWIAERWEEVKPTPLKKLQRKSMAPEQLSDKNKAEDNEYLLSLEHRLLVFETFAEADIAECMKADELQEIADDMIAGIEFRNSTE